MARDEHIRAAVKRVAELDPRPFKLCRGFWAAASQSRPGHGYMLEVAEGKVRCECPAYEYRGVCAHSCYVAIEEGLLPLRFLLDDVDITPVVREVEPTPLRVPAGLHGRRSLYGEGA